MWRNLLMAVWMVVLPVGANAQSAPKDNLAAKMAALEPLFQATRFRALVAQSAQSNIDSADDVARDMFGAVPVTDWHDQIAAIHDADVMAEKFLSNFAATFDMAHYDEALAFWTSDLGQTIIVTELSARKAFEDELLKQAAIDAYQEIAAARGPRQQAIERLVTANGFLDKNLQLKMNLSYVFISELAHNSDRFAGQGDEDLLRMIWQNEGDYRMEVTEWVYGFSALALQPLEVAEIDLYTDFGETEAGRSYMLALFAAYEMTYRDVTRAFAGVIARHLRGQDL